MAEQEKLREMERLRVAEVAKKRKGLHPAFLVGLIVLAIGVIVGGYLGIAKPVMEERARVAAEKERVAAEAAAAEAKAAEAKRLAEAKQAKLDAIAQAEAEEKRRKEEAAARARARQQKSRRRSRKRAKENPTGGLDLSGL